jgi:hypothetical protein
MQAVLDETSGGLGGDLAVAVATMKNLKVVKRNDLTGTCSARNVWEILPPQVLLAL